MMSAACQVRRVLMTADAVGGVWTYACELIASLRERGVATELAALGSPPARHEIRRAEACGAASVHVIPGKLEWMPDPWRDVAAAGHRLLEIADRSDADVIHLNGFSHAALPFRQPAIVVGHSCVRSWFEGARGCEPPAEFDRYRESVTRGLRSAALVTAPSAAMLASLRRHYGPFQEAKPIYNAARAAAGPAARKQPIVMTAGRIWDAAKNIAALDRIAPKVPWPIVAAGPCRSPEGTRTEFPNLLLLGSLSHDRLLSELAAAPIYVHPARYEPFGLSVLEAANAGCALLLSDIPTLRELWGDAAVFVPLDEGEALAEGLNMLILEERVRNRLAAAARARAGMFQPPAQARAYIELYERALSPSPPPRDPEQLVQRAPQ